MELINRKIFDKIVLTFKIQKLIIILFGSILVPVFLITRFPTNSPTDAATLIPVTFEIKNPANNFSTMKKYELKATLIFANIFKAKVTSEVFEALQKDPMLAYAQVDQKMEIATIMTSDPFFTTDPNATDKQWYLAKTHIPEAWEYSKGNNSIVVAVVDTGIHASHIELNDGRIVAGFNTLTNQPIAANIDSDDNGHGTSVAGVIGAIPNNQKGIAGIDWNVQIMPIKALAADGTGDTSTVAAGIVWAADHGANIVNLSLGGSGFLPDQTLTNAVTYAYNKGLLIVSAAGNDSADHGLNLDTFPVYPICADNGSNMVLGVAATDANDQKADFSNFGKKCVDISAPGKKIITSAFFPNDPSNNVLIYGSGTSLAAPIVSGIAALLKSANPNLSNVEIRNAIIKTADNIDFVNQNTCFFASCVGLLGSGRINALAALAPLPIINGTLAREASTGNLYLVLNNTKRLVSDFVFKQRGFNPAEISTQLSIRLASFPTITPLPPLDGTLVKSDTSPQVYVIEAQLKRPVIYPVFISRGYSFANISILSQIEIDSYQAGDWYWPPDGTTVLISGDTTVYVMDNQVRRPVTFFVFTQRHLSFAKVLNVTGDEFSHLPQPSDFYWLAPLDGTLVKSDTDPAIYIIENATRRVLSFQAFAVRGFSLKNVRILPAAEINVIAPGMSIL